MMKLSKDLSESLKSAINTLRQINKLNEIKEEGSNIGMLKNQDTSQAQKIFEQYQKEYSSLEPELVWEYSALGNQYQILLFDSKDTITISLCPERFVPWTLRNATHPREIDFVVVNGFVLNVFEVMEIIDDHLENADVRASIINQAILKLESAQMPESEQLQYAPSEKQMQVAFDRWRLKRNLNTKLDYENYLKASGLDHKVIERKIKHIEWTHNFYDSKTKISTKEYFSENKQEFTKYKLEIYITTSKEEAEKLEGFLKDNPNELGKWAKDKFLASDTETSSDINSSSYQLTTCFQYQLDPKLLVSFSDKPKAGWLPTTQINGKYNFVNILKCYPSKLDENTELLIRERLVREFVEEKKKSSNIQWLWGDKDIFENYNIQD